MSAIVVVIDMLLGWACAIVILFVSFWAWYGLPSPYRSRMTKRERERLTAERDGRTAYPCHCGPRRYQITPTPEEAARVRELLTSDAADDFGKGLAIPRDGEDAPPYPPPPDYPVSRTAHLIPHEDAPTSLRTAARQAAKGFNWVDRAGNYGAPPGVRCSCGAQLHGHDPGDEDSVP